MATVPQGWTIDPDQLNAAALWSPNGEGTLLATQRSLPAPYAAIMCTDPRTGDALYMFSGAEGRTIYLWNRVDGDVFAVTQPNTQQEIVDSMTKNEGKTVQLQVTEV